MSGRSRLRHLPNAISAARIVAAPVLLLLAWQRLQAPYSWLLVGALISDIVDGIAARVLHAHSALGATLDSIADVLTLIAAAYGIAVFHPQVFADHGIACWTVLGGWIVVCALALLRYGRLSSFHTYASKAAGYALGIFIAVLFVAGFVPELFYVAAAVSIGSSLEELALLRVLPQWRADVRGLWWVLRDPASR